MSDELRELVTQILDDERPAYSLRSQVLGLGTLLANAAGTTFDRSDDLAKGETRTDTGVAISPAMAAMCVEDYVRTIQFIRGLSAAIVDVRQGVVDRPVRILYAGCGPFATLAVPVMSVLSPGEAEFSLIDLHDDAIRSARMTVSELGLERFIDEMVVADAAQHEIKTEPDIILIEMLRATLRAEPQVAVMRNLAFQAPRAVLLPQRVAVELMLVTQSREFDMDGSGTARERTSLGEVFVVDRAALDQWRNESVEFLDSTTVTVSVDPAPGVESMLFTNIQVYDDYWLTGYDSGITYPRQLRPGIDLKEGDRIKFRYELQPMPQLVFEIDRDTKH